MTTVINTNIASQIAQNYLQSNQAAVTSAITQLSSGLAINSAADNPAGLAIATTLQAQINGQTVAQQNANNGISLAQTGQSALTQVTNNLQTIRQLAVQAANASNTAANRAALNQQVQQALAQINTIATTTSFNGQNLLDGSFGSQNFQIGANAGQTIAVNLSQGTQTSQIGQTSSTTFTLQGTNGGLSTESLNISLGGAAAVTVANAVAGTGAGQTADSAYAAAAAINNSNISGLTATASNSQTFNFANITNTTGTASEAYNLTINGTNIFGSGGLSVNVGQTVTASTIVNAINGQSGNTGVTATLSSDGQSITLGTADGSNIIVTQSSSGGSDVAGGLSNNNVKINNTDGTLNVLSAGTASSTSGQLAGTVTLSSADSIQLSGSAAADIAGQYDNSTNASDSLQTTQTITATTAFNAGTSGGTINFYVGDATTPISLKENSTATATQVVQDINNSGLLQQAGISASLNSQGQLVVTNNSGKALAIANSGAGFDSGIANAATYTTATPYTPTTIDGSISIKLGTGSAATSTSVSIAKGASATDVANAINKANISGIQASADAQGNLTIENTSGQTLQVTDPALSTGLETGATPTPSTTTTTSITSATAYTSTATAGTITLTVGGTAEPALNIDANASAQDIADAINGAGYGVQASVSADGKLSVENTSGGTLSVAETGITTGLAGTASVTTSTVTSATAYDPSAGAGTISIQLGTGTAQSVSIAANATAADVASAINTAGIAGIQASVTNDGKLSIANSSGQTLTVTDPTITTGLESGTTNVAADTVASTTNYTAASSGSLASIDVLTVADAQKTIQAVDSALNQISTLQGQLGAVQNRFTSVISNLSSSVQNAQSAQSSIQDTNYASETSALSRAQVLSQAAQAMVAQANQLPQQVLKLLQ